MSLIQVFKLAALQPFHGLLDPFLRQVVTHADYGVCRNIFDTIYASGRLNCPSKVVLLIG